jgi:hypothetical protein
MLDAERATSPPMNTGLLFLGYMLQEVLLRCSFSDANLLLLPCGKGDKLLRSSELDGRPLFRATQSLSF